MAGIVKKPGTKSTMAHSVRKMIARKWLAVAKSNAASSLRLEFAGFTDCWPAPNRRGCTVSTILFAYDETALQTTPQFLLSGAVPGPLIRQIVADYCTRITTVSAAPVASITVRRAKPGPGGAARPWGRPAISPPQHPVCTTGRG